MKYGINIGEIKIVLKTPFEIFWNEEDKKFLSNIVEEDYLVEVIECDKLPEFSGESVYKSKEMEVYKAEEREIRYYFAPKKRKPYVCSCCLHNNVKIYIDINNYMGKMEVQNSIWSFMFLEKLLLGHGGLVLHCSYIECEGQGICFTAPSGTGKTTQAKHWVKLYCAHIINGDKALLGMSNGQWFVHGYPFHGSAEECENCSLPLKSIVIIRQGIKNEIRELSFAEKIKLLYSEMTVNVWDYKSVTDVLNRLEDIAKKIDVIIFYCTKDSSSAEVLHQYLCEGVK